MASLSLANYSEFGLIVGAIGAKTGWLSDRWLVILAVAVAISFIVAAPVGTAAHRIYDRFRQKLTRFEVGRTKDEYSVLVTATAKYDDEVRELEENGVDAAFNLYAEAGQGFADLVRASLESRRG